MIRGHQPGRGLRISKLSRKEMTDMSEPDRLKFVRRLSYVLDSAIPIPGTRYRVGLDPIIGLIPGVGDAVTSLMSTYLVLVAMQMKVSRFTLIRMVFNIAIESIVGIIPVVGDFFDAYWKANERNRILLEKSIMQPQGKTVDTVFVVGVILVLLGILGLTAYGAISLLQWLVHQV